MLIQANGLLAPASFKLMYRYESDFHLVGKRANICFVYFLDLSSADLFVDESKLNGRNFHGT